MKFAIPDASVDAPLVIGLADPISVKSPHRRVLAHLSCSAALVVLVPCAVQAQDAAANVPPPPTASSSATSAVSPADIVVTAERRSSTVQRIPIAITAISGKDLQARGITNVTDAVRGVPGISIRSAGPSQTEYQLRGLSSTGGAAPTVGFYLDDAPLTPPAAALNGKVVVDPSLFDLARVEVLRGPQGTLYGSGSMGGTIRLITNEPSFDGFAGAALLDGSGTSGGNVPNGAANLMLNIPIVHDVVALRLVGTERYTSGWIDRIVAGDFPLPSNDGCTPTSFYGCARGDVTAAPVQHDYHDVNWTHFQSVRGQVLIKPVDDLKINTSLMYQTTKQGGANTFDEPPGPDGNLAHYQPANIKEPFTDRFFLAANTISYDFGAVGLNLATTYWHRRSAQTQDSDENYQNLFSLPDFVVSPDVSTTELDTSHQFSEELRLTSQGGGRFSWIAGLYYANLTSTFQQISISPALCFLSAGGCAANPTGIQYLATNPYHIRQYAAYGEASYKITDALTATVGLRYFNFRNQVDYAQSGVFAQSGNTGITSGGITSKNSGVTPKFNVSYEPSRDLTLYATVSKGFRPGGVNLPLPISGPNSCLPYLEAIGRDQAPLSYKPDSVWNYEAGEKARLFDSRLTINGSFYYIRWQNIQQPLTLACGYPYTDNAGTARSYGPELEVNFKLTPELTIDAGGTLINANLIKAAPNTGLVPGARILNVPRYTANAAINYARRVSSSYILNARFSSTTSGPTDDLAFSRVRLPSYTNFDARIELARNDGLTVGAYVNNITNHVDEISANNTSITFNSPSLTRISTNQPRTIGMDMRFKF